MPTFKKDTDGFMKKSSGFKLKSGNSTTFKMMGSSPMRQDFKTRYGTASKEGSVRSEGADDPRDDVRFTGLSDERIDEILRKEAEREEEGIKTGRGNRPEIKSQDAVNEPNVSVSETEEGLSSEELARQKYEEERWREKMERGEEREKIETEKDDSKQGDGENKDEKKEEKPWWKKISASDIAALGIGGPAGYAGKKLIEKYMKSRAKKKKD